MNTDIQNVSAAPLLQQSCNGIWQKITNAVTKLLNVYCRKKRQTLEESVTRLFVAHVKFSEKLLTANDRYHSRKINLGNEVQAVVKKTQVFRRIFVFETHGNFYNDECVCWLQIVMEWKKSVRCRMRINLFCLTRENFPRGFNNKEDTHIY